MVFQGVLVSIDSSYELDNENYGNLNMLSTYESGEIKKKISIDIKIPKFDTFELYVSLSNNDDENEKRFFGYTYIKKAGSDDVVGTEDRITNTTNIFNDITQLQSSKDSYMLHKNEIVSLDIVSKKVVLALKLVVDGAISQNTYKDDFIVEV